MDNERCLVNLLEELLEEYRRHHRNMLAQYERLSFQLDTLVENGGYSDVSVHCHSSSSDNVSTFTRHFCAAIYCGFYLCLCFCDILCLPASGGEVFHPLASGLFVTHTCLLH